MPLSEYEQRVLEQMEQQLRSDDPRLVEVISGQGVRKPVNMALGVVVIIAGLGGLLGGVASSQIWLGAIGFLVMFGGVLLAMRRSHGGPTPKRSHPSSPKPGKPTATADGKGFMDRLDERWDDRRNNP